MLENRVAGTGLDVCRNGACPDERTSVPNAQYRLEPKRIFPDGHIRGVRSWKSARFISFANANAVPVLASLAFVVLATACLFTLNYFVPLNLIPLFYLLPVVLAATRWGIVPAVTAAVSGALAADFFFYPPLFSLWIHDPQHVIDLIVFLVVAVVTSDLAARLRTEADNLRLREAEIRDLYAFSQRLATCFTSSELIFAIQDYLSNTLGYHAVLIANTPQGHGDEFSKRGEIPEQIRRKISELIEVNDEPKTRVILDTSSSGAWLIRVVSPEALGYRAIAVDLGDSAKEEIDGVTYRVDAMLEQASKTLARLKVAAAIEQARVKYQADTLRDALVGSVSHELRTPLASIIGSASVLAQMPAILHDARSHALVEAIHNQAGQLDTDIHNLLGATRITANGVRPRLEWADPVDIVHAAVSQKGRRLAHHSVHLDLAPDLPLLKVDSALVEQALEQILDNAAKYSPAGSPVTVAARFEQGQVVLSVTDKGAGLTSDEKMQFGRRSFRGQRHAVGSSGSGLGLWVASTLVAANGGTVNATSQGPDYGTTVTLRLPAAASDVPETANALDE